MKPKHRTGPVATARDEWKQIHDRCMNPGCKASGSRGDIMDVHEILGASDRAKTIMLPAYWLLLCRKCHEQLPSRPHRDCLVRQLAVKLWADDKNADSMAVITLWRPNATEEFRQEVLQQVWAEYKRIVKEYS
jgi:hypothetical protein